MSRNYNRFSEFSLNFLIQNWACTTSTLLPLLITATSKHGQFVLSWQLRYLLF